MRQLLFRLYIFFMLIICIESLLGVNGGYLDVLLGIGLVVSPLLLIYRIVVARNISLFVVFIFMASYFLAPIGYLLGIQENILEGITEYESHSRVTMVSAGLLLFIIMLNIKLQPNIYYKNGDNLLFRNTPSGKAFKIALIASIACMILGISGATLFEAGGYNEDVASRSPLFEYGLVFIGLSLIYSRNNKDRNVVYIICIIYILRDLLFGGRVSSFMLILMVYNLRFLNKYTFKQIIVFMIVGYVFFQFWGVFRSALSQEDIDLFKKDENASTVFYASMRIHYMIDNGAFPMELRFISFLSFVASIFLPSSLIPPFGDLASYASDLYSTGGGCLITTYFYTWLWIPGIFIIGYYIGNVFNNLYNPHSVYKRFYAILVLITIPRWFAYNPIQIFKYALFGIILLWLFNKVFLKKVKI